MGQYYRPTNLSKGQSIYSHDYNVGLKLMEHSYIGNPLLNVVEKLLSPNNEWHKTQLVWAGDYADTEEERNGEGNAKENLYSIFVDMKITPPTEEKEGHRFIVNHSKKVFVDKEKVNEVDGWRIHPLPLFTCEGNGRGGGDFRGNDERIGSWARDVISVENDAPQDYEEVDGNFTENN